MVQGKEGQEMSKMTITRNGHSITRVRSIDTNDTAWNVDGVITFDDLTSALAWADSRK